MRSNVTLRPVRNDNLAGPEQRFAQVRSRNC